MEIQTDQVEENAIMKEIQAPINSKKAKSKASKAEKESSSN